MTESFTDSELTSLANQKLHGPSIRLDNVIVHATAYGTIESQAKAHWGGQTMPLNVPQPLTDQINSLVEQSLNLGPASSILSTQGHYHRRITYNKRRGQPA